MHNQLENDPLSNDNIVLKLSKKSDTISSRSEAFNEIINYRRAIRDYDPNADFNSEVVRRSMERALLSPSSSNLQLWEFHRIRDKESLKQMTRFCMGQHAAKTANELVVIAVRIDKIKEHIQWNEKIVQNAIMGHKPDKIERKKLNYYQKLLPFMYSNDPLGIWGKIKNILLWTAAFKKPTIRRADRTSMRIMAHKSVALAAQTFMLALASEGYDSCPMEGFDSVRIKKFLKLPHKSEINMVISVGIRKPERNYGPRPRINTDQVIFEH